MSKTALLIVDVQNDFLPPDGALPAPKGAEIVPVIQRLLDPAEFDWDLVVASQDFHPPGHISFASTHSAEPFQERQLVDGRGRTYTQQLWPDHCIQGKHGCALQAQVEDALAPWWSKGKAKLVRKAAERDVEMYSMFEGYVSGASDSRHPDESAASGSLDTFLRDRGVEKVVVVGLVTDYCVRDSALAALEHGFKTVLCLPGCSGIDDKAAATAVEKVRRQGAVVVDDKEGWGPELKSLISTTR